MNKTIEKCASLGEEQFDDPEFDWLNYPMSILDESHVDSVDARATKEIVYDPIYKV